MISSGSRLSALALALLASGCGSSNTARVSGTLTKDGQPLQVTDGQWCIMNLYPVDLDPSKFPPFAANVSKDGKFEVPGVENRGIPPGKYRVAVELVNHKDRGKDLLNNAFTSTKSPIIREITGSTSLAVDLSADAK